MKLRRGDSTDGADASLGDLLRRLASRGVTVQPFEEDGYLLSRAGLVEVYFFENPISEAEVRRIAELFGLDRKQLYFDVVESDLN